MNGREIILKNFSFKSVCNNFLMLYDLCTEPLNQIVERIHKEHIQSLVKSKKILKKAKKREIRSNDGSV